MLRDLTRMQEHMSVRDYMHYIGDLSLIYHSRIGPLSLSATKYNFTSRNNLYVMFNFGNPIFGKRGLYY